MGWNPGSSGVNEGPDEENAEPVGPDGNGAAALSGGAARDERLSGFASAGEWDNCLPGPELAAALAAVSGPEWRCPGATPDELVGVLRRLSALESYAQAGKLGVIREMIRRDVPLAAGRTIRGDLSGQWSDSLNHELALALASSVLSAGKTAWLARELGTRLAGIEPLLADGTLTLAKARLVAETFALLSDADAARAEALLIPFLTGKAGKTFGKLSNLANRIAAQVDPGLAQRRRAAAVKHAARVQLFREESGAAALCGRDLPPDETLAASANVNARAAQYKASGAFPGVWMDQLRATAYLDLINDRPAEARIALGYLAADSGHGDEPPDNDSPDDTGLPDYDDPDRDDSDRDDPGDDGPDDGSLGGDDPGDFGLDGGGPSDDDQDDDGPGGFGPDDGDSDGGDWDDFGLDGADPDDEEAGDFVPGDEGLDALGPEDRGPKEESSVDDCVLNDGTGHDVAGHGAPAVTAPEGGSPSGAARSGRPGSSGAGRPDRGRPSYNGASSSDRPALADLVIPLVTLLALGERPGEAHRLGVLDPDLCRDLAALAAASPRTEICVTVTDPGGVTIGHGCARSGTLTGKGMSPGVPTSGPPPCVSLPARLNLTVTADYLSAMSLIVPGRPSAPGQQTTGWALARVEKAGPGDTTRADGSRCKRNEPGDPEWCGTWALTLPGGRQLDVRIEPVATHTCDHRHESFAYQPNVTLRHHVQIRDYICTFPSCNRHARESDFEHAQPYDQDGRTCACNAGARSRKCHRVKQSKGWSVTQPKPAWHVWTTPTGRTYTQAPYQYPV